MERDGGGASTVSGVWGVEGLIQELPIEILHLGAKTATLKRAGFRSVGDFQDDSVGRVQRLPAVGRRTIDLLQYRLQTLFACQGGEGGIDFERYFSEIQIPLIPSRAELSSGEEFLASLPLVFAEVADHIGDETSAQILQERLCKRPGEQRTLGQIAQSSRPPVTRERIRQKEKKLLGRLVDGLLNDNYSEFSIHFRPEFSRWWRLASEKLPANDDIGSREFVYLLSSVWDVSPASVVGQLPIVLAIITGQSTMSTEFRSIEWIDPKWFKTLGQSVRSVPVRRLRIGKYADQLTAAGYLSLDDVVTGLKSGAIQGGVSRAMDSFVSHLNLLASCIDDDGAVDWEKYRRSLDLERLPSSSPENALEFAQELPKNVERLLDRCNVTRRSAVIYNLRTCRDVKERKTLRQVANELKTHQPTIKREESVLLKFLNDVLIFGELSNLPVWLDEEWIKYWSEAASVFEVSDDNYRTFSRNLAWRWRLTGQSTRQAAPSMWAVLNGYPDGKPRPESGVIGLDDPGKPVGRIKLKGFRRVH